MTNKEADGRNWNNAMKRTLGGFDYRSSELAYMWSLEKVRTAIKSAEFLSAFRKKIYGLVVESEDRMDDPILSALSSMVILNQAVKAKIYTDKIKRRIYSMKNFLLQYLYENGFAKNVFIDEVVDPNGKILVCFEFVYAGKKYVWHQHLGQAREFMNVDCLSVRRSTSEVFEKLNPTKDEANEEYDRLMSAIASIIVYDIIDPLLEDAQK